MKKKERRRKKEERKEGKEVQWEGNKERNKRSVEIKAYHNVTYLAYPT